MLPPESLLSVSWHHHWNNLSYCLWRVNESKSPCSVMRVGGIAEGERYDGDILWKGFCLLLPSPLLPPSPPWDSNMCSQVWLEGTDSAVFQWKAWVSPSPFVQGVGPPCALPPLRICPWKWSFPQFTGWKIMRLSGVEVCFYVAQILRSSYKRVLLNYCVFRNILT